MTQAPPGWTGGRALRMFTLAFLAWMLPYGLFTLFVATAELAPPFDAIRPLEPAVAAFTVIVGVIAATAIVLRHRYLLALAAEGGSGETLRIAVRRTLLALPLLLAAYEIVGGALAVAIAASAVGAALPAWSGGPLLATAACLLASWGLILQPLWFLCLDEFGRDFGAALGDRPLVPMWTRSLPGPTNAFIIALVLCLQEYARTGDLHAGTGALAAVLVVYSVALVFINVRYSGNAVHSMNRFLGAPEEVPDGPLRPEALDEVGVLYGRVGTLLARLRASDTRFREFAAAASDLFVETDADLRIRWVSDGAEEVTATPPGWLLGKSIAALSREPFTEGGQAAEIAYASHAPVRDLRLSFDSPAGRRVLRVAFEPYADEAGDFGGYRGTATDLTALLATEDRLREREVQLAQAQKMEAVGQLTGGVAHDFNNLLLVVLGNLELARDEADGALRRELLDQALQASQRGAAMIQQLLSFARRQVLNPEPLDVTERLEAMRGLLRTTLGERIALEIDVAPGLGRPLVDVSQFESALLNLAINARDAMPGGGRLRIAARSRRLEVDADGLVAGDYVVLAVEDTGRGMDAEVLARAFDPFFSTKEAGRGSGLGLSMVHGFVAQSRGRVDLESTPGVGTRVILTFPGEPDAAPEPAVAPSAEAPSRAVLHILVVEDDAAVRATLLAALRTAGHVVTTAEDVSAARDRLAAGAAPDLLLSDVVLPGESGVDFVASVRRERPALPCLLMSGYADRHAAGLPESLRGVELLPKPFRIPELLERIDAVVRGWPAPGGPQADRAVPETRR